MACAGIHDIHAEGALGDAAEMVFRDAIERVALPKRFSIVTREIWELQPRLATNSPSRAKRLMRHPRFRAAFDFLLLRAAVDPELASQAARWERAQTCAETEFDGLFKNVPAGPAMAAMAPTDDAKPAKKRRRRRRRVPGSGGGSDAPTE